MSGHRVVHYRARQAGAWCRCECGWRSDHWTTITGSNYEFGLHLLAAERARKGSSDEQ